MQRFYKSVDGELFYWETWENTDRACATIHFGKVGEEGTVEVLSSDENSSYRTKVSQIINSLEGFEEKTIEHFETLIIEYAIKGFGSDKDLQKRRALQDRMQETLGWKGLGFCDGGSAGGDSMEVCCLVIDYDIAKKVIEEDLKDTPFNDYSRMYLEERA